MSIEVNVITGRKKALATLLKAVAEFTGSTGNKRVSMQLSVNLNPKDNEHKC